MPTVSFSKIDEVDNIKFKEILFDELQIKLLENREVHTKEEAKKLTDKILKEKLPTTTDSSTNFVRNIFSIELQKKVGFFWMIISPASEIHEAKNTARMAFIYIFEPFRRKGLAKCAILNLEQELLDKYHCIELTLNVFRSNHEAIDLYQALGFHENLQKSTSSRSEMMKILHKGNVKGPRPGTSISDNGQPDSAVDDDYNFRI